MDEGVITATEKYIEIWSEVEDDLLKKGWNIFYKQDLIKDVPINIGGPEYTLEDLHLVTCIRCQWRRKTVQLWRDKIDHLVQKPSPRIIIHTPST